MSDGKRSLPSWISSKGNKKISASEKDPTSQDHFSVLLEGVVFVLSGFVNPERSTLRSRALEMGAEYRADWTSDCTLLVCAFPNTPKFRQVESDGGTIISKEWLLECFNQKKLVDIEPYLLHAGKPWRSSSKQHKNTQVQKVSLSKEAGTKSETREREKLTGTAGSKGRISNTVSNQFSPTKIKQWASDDLRTTISWLESKEEAPKKNELNAIAAQGILTCLQDAIDSLGQNQDVRSVTEQWMFVPRVVKELAELDGSESTKEPISKSEVSDLATKCKRIYEEEFSKLDGSTEGKTHKANPDKGKGVQKTSNEAVYDSDETIEMTEEEIELACKQLT